MLGGELMVLQHSTSHIVPNTQLNVNCWRLAVTLSWHVTVTLPCHHSREQTLQAGVPLAPSRPWELRWEQIKSRSCPIQLHNVVHSEWKAVKLWEKIERRKFINFYLFKMSATFWHLLINLVLLMPACRVLAKTILRCI